MNFVCDRCKQKYHVADEKLRGRGVTKFRCKKCEHVIELDLAASEASTVATPAAEEAPTATAPTATVAAKPGPRPVTAPLSRPRAATMVGGAVAASASAPRPAPRPRSATVTGVALGAAAKPAMRAPAERSTSAILNASETGWYAGIRDLPVGPLTRKELLAKVQSGDVTADTLVWREGLDDWRPLRNVAELGDMLRAGAQKLSGSLLDEMGKRPAPPRGAQVVAIGAARSAAPRAPAVDEDEEATKITGLDPAIAAMAARALAKPRAGDSEGDDQTQINARDEVTAAPAAKRAADEPARFPSHGAASPPVSERPAAHAPAAAPSTRPPPPAATPSSRPPAPPPPAALTSRPPPPPAETGDELPENLFAKPPAPKGAPVDFGADASAPASLASPLLSPLMAPVPAPQPVPAPPPVLSAPPAPQARSGLSAAVFVLIGGVLVAGVGVGIYIGRQNGAPAPTPAPVAVPTPAPAPVAAAAPAAPQAQGPNVGEIIALNPPAPAAPEAPAAQANPSEPHVGANGSRPHAGSTHTRSSAPSAAAAQLTAAERAALRELGAQPTAVAAGGPVGNTALRTQTDPSAAPSSGVPGESEQARARRSIPVFQSSRVADNCWQLLLRQNPAMRSTRVTIQYTVSTSGRFTDIEVQNSPDPRFTQCIRSRSGGIAPMGGGPAASARVTVNLTAN